MATCTNANCGYEWKPRTKSPKSCPRCKNYIKLRGGENTGEKNGQWKGDNVGYGALHDYVKTRFPKPDVCNSCGLKPPRDLANVSGKYKRDLTDWEWLCRKCHMEKDGRLAKMQIGLNSKNYLKEKKTPHPISK